MFRIYFTFYVSRTFIVFFENIHSSNYINCCCSNFRATISATNQKHCIFHDFQQKNEIIVLKSRYQNEIIVEHLIVQSDRHAKSTVDQSEFVFFDFILWLWHIVARFHVQPLFCHVIQSRLKSDPCPRDQANVWGDIFFIDRVTAVFEVKNFFVVKCSLRIKISHQCRRRVTDQLSDEKTTIDKKKF